MYTFLLDKYLQIIPLLFTIPLAVIITRYNPLTQEWAKDECVLKMEVNPFAHGAMRECFRMKKLSNFSHNSDWLRLAD